MKITIEPSETENMAGHRRVIFDTRTNDDTTGSAVRAVLDAVVAHEHFVGNVAEAAREWAEEKLTP
jgi:hypothetical protein